MHFAASSPPFASNATLAQTMEAMDIDAVTPVRPQIASPSILAHSLLKALLARTASREGVASRVQSRIQPRSKLHATRLASPPAVLRAKFISHRQYPHGLSHVPQTLQGHRPSSRQTHPKAHSHRGTLFHAVDFRNGRREIRLPILPGCDSARVDLAIVRTASPTGKPDSVGQICCALLRLAEIPFPFHVDRCEPTDLLP